MAGVLASWGKEHALAKNPICFGYNKIAEAAVRLYDQTFPERPVLSVHYAPDCQPGS
jgi:predicted 3-demethylubiquinone-9 3-methyltransferase (glyoxalase superfamily)